MVDLLKKTLYISLGMIAMTRDKIEAMGKKLADDAKLSESEGKQFVDELLKKSDEMKASVEKIVAEKTEATLSKLNLPTKAEMAKLEERIRKLEGKSGQDTL